jgi:hypothetical protein
MDLTCRVTPCTNFCIASIGSPQVCTLCEQRLLCTVATTDDWIMTVKSMLTVCTVQAANETFTESLVRVALRADRLLLCTGHSYISMKVTR